MALTERELSQSHHENPRDEKRIVVSGGRWREEAPEVKKTFGVSGIYIKDEEFPYPDESGSTERFSAYRVMTDGTVEIRSTQYSKRTINGECHTGYDVPPYPSPQTPVFYGFEASIAAVSRNGEDTFVLTYKRKPLSQRDTHEA